MVALWVLNGGEDGECWGKRERIGRRCRNQCSPEGFALLTSHVFGNAGTRVVLVLGSAVKS